MARVFAVAVFGLVGLTGSSVMAQDADASGCVITVSACKNFPEFQRSQFRDSIGEDHVGAGSNDAACLKRAEDMHHFCGNSASEAQVAATFSPRKLSQVYHPGACEKGWSQWDTFCYKHFWEKKTWFEAEAICRQIGAHLASIHSQAENRFIYTLTSGLSTWIGYTDLDQDTHFQWSDSTQDDFSNLAKNCTGRETEADCQPEERKQQWYNWEGHDAGTYVCKKNALLPVALLVNVSAQSLRETEWSQLLPALLAGSASPKAAAAEGLLNVTAAMPSLKAPEIPSAKAPSAGGAPKAKEAAAPKLAVPKGSFGL